MRLDAFRRWTACAGSLLGGVLFALLAACSGRIGSQGGDNGASGSGNGAAASSGGPGAGFAGDNASSSLEVAISPVASTVCPGECVTLTAHAAGTDAPITLTWDDGSTGTQRQVCPSTSGAYLVVASTGGVQRGELPTASEVAHASATVTVSASCDGGAPPASDFGALNSGAEGPEQAAGCTGARTPASTPTGPAHTICSLTWPMSSMSGILTSPSMHTTVDSVAVDPQGNIIVVGTYAGTASAPGHTYTAAGSHDTLVVKLDAQCKPVWTKDLGGYFGDMEILVVKAGPDSSIVLAGRVSGLVDLGTGAINTNKMGDALVMKLDPSGKPLWANHYESTVLENSLNDIAVDRSGNVIVAIQVGGDTDFGGGPAGGDAGAHPSLSDAYLLKLGPDGSFRYAKPAAALAPEDWDLYTVDTTCDGSIWIAGIGGLSASFSDARIALVSAGGSPMESRTLGAGTPDGSLLTAIKVGPFDDIVLSGGTVTTNVTTSLPSPWGRWVQKLASSDAPLWATPTVMPGDEAFSTPAMNVGVDAAGDVLVGGQFEGTLGGPGAVTSAGQSDVYAALVDPSGVERSVARWGGPDWEYLYDMAMTREGSVVLSGWTTNQSPDVYNAATNTSAMFVAKLGW
jgi:hypothetical protein